MFIRLYAQTASYGTFFRSRKGQILVEYSVILGVVSLVVVSVLMGMSAPLQTIFPQVSSPFVASY
jgi:Flp pilus assembly pilin Flp